MSFTPDLDAAIKMVMEMMAIPGPSAQEGKIAAYITDKLRRAGAPASAISTDTANKKSTFGGESGNLILKLPGTGDLTRAPRRMLTAHIDTVPLCVGCKPVRKGSRVVPAAKDTALGADDRAGAAAILNAAIGILKHKLPHPPVTFVWLVQEEVGLYGARHLDIKKLGNPKLAFNYDGGSSVKLVVGATGAYRLRFDVHGIASHAGVHPELGVSAITIASVAIAALHRDGWLGLIHKRGPQGGKGTSNVGIIQAGAATNVVTNHAMVRAEARSHDPAFRKRIRDAFIDAFESAARQVRSAAGESGRVTVTQSLDYESFKLRDSEPCLLEAEAAIRAQGEEPIRAISNGGLDANWLTAHGIPAVTLGAGQENPHTVDEGLSIHEFQQACRIALSLATGGGRRQS